MIDVALNSKTSNEIPISTGTGDRSSFSQYDREGRNSVSSVFDKRKGDEYEASEKVRLAAEHVFLLFFNYLGNFPLEIGPSSLSSLHSEVRFLLFIYLFIFIFY